MNKDAGLTLTQQVGRKPIVALILGIAGMIAWIIPIIGLPIGIVGLVMGIIGTKDSRKGMAVVGIILSALCLVLTIINTSIGAYQGFHGMAWFQNGESNENVKENEFFIKDRWGKVLMSGGIEEAEARIEKQLDEEMAVVEIVFTDIAVERFAKITKEYVGEQIVFCLNKEQIAEVYVQLEIIDGRCQIAMDSLKEAESIAEKLNNTK